MTVTVAATEDSLSSREHGTYAKYKLEGCRCYPCAGAVSRYNAARERMIAYGTWRPFVPAGPVREHVRSLMAAGVGRRRIVELSGVGGTVVGNLLYGRQGRPPTRRLRPETAVRLLAVRPDPAAHALVDATGYRRRMQALVALGFPKTFVADRLGVELKNFRIEAEKVTSVTDRRAREIYDDLWNADPGLLGVSLHSRNRARNLAAANGWAVPQAWDDERIDDPRGRPRGAVRREVKP